jgi:hypothetical protein
MSAAKNSASVANQGEFHSSRPGAEPLEKGGVSLLLTHSFIPQLSNMK